MVAFCICHLPRFDLQMGARLKSVVQFAAFSSVLASSKCFRTDVGCQQEFCTFLMYSFWTCLNKFSVYDSLIPSRNHENRSPSPIARLEDRLAISCGYQRLLSPSETLSGHLCGIATPRGSVSRFHLWHFGHDSGPKQVNQSSCYLCGFLHIGLYQHGRSVMQ